MDVIAKTVPITHGRIRSLGHDRDSDSRAGRRIFSSAASGPLFEAMLRLIVTWRQYAQSETQCPVHPTSLPARARQRHSLRARPSARVLRSLKDLANLVRHPLPPERRANALTIASSNRGRGAEGHTTTMLEGQGRHVPWLRAKSDIGPGAAPHSNDPPCRSHAERLDGIEKGRQRGAVIIDPLNTERLAEAGIILRWAALATVENALAETVIGVVTHPL